MKRGQLSLFLIIAAVLVIVVMLGIRLAAQLAPNTTANTFPVSAKDGNTTLCLRDATTNAILQAMQVGGVNDELNPLNPDYNDKAKSVKMGIKRLEPPRVSMLGEFEPDITFIPDPSNPQLGVVTFDPLCSRRGSNQPNADGNGANTCLRGTYYITGPRKSFQEVLEARIMAAIKDVPGCPELTSPLILTLGQSDVTATVGNESVRVPIRLKAMYNAALTIARLEASDPSFNTNGANVPLPCETELNSGNCLLPGLTYKSIMEPNECDWRDADLIDACLNNNGPMNWQLTTAVVIVTDTTVRIDGKNPEFRFAIKNRYPFLSEEYRLGKIASRTISCDAYEFEQGLSQERSVSLPLGLDVDDQPSLVLMNWRADPINRACTGSCSLTAECQDYGEGEMKPFPVVFCSTPSGANDAQYNYVFNNMPFLQPYDCEDLLLEVTMQVVRPPCTVNTYPSSIPTTPYCQCSPGNNEGPTSSGVCCSNGAIESSCSPPTCSSTGDSNCVCDGSLLQPGNVCCGTTETPGSC